jgi:hypothetical protein
MLPGQLNCQGSIRVTTEVPFAIVLIPLNLEKKKKHKSRKESVGRIWHVIGNFLLREPLQYIAPVETQEK